MKSHSSPCTDLLHRSGSCPLSFKFSHQFAVVMLPFRLAMELEGERSLLSFLSSAFPGIATDRSLFAPGPSSYSSSLPAGKCFVSTLDSSSLTLASNSSIYVHLSCLQSKPEAEELLSLCSLVQKRQINIQIAPPVHIGWPH